jgi:hypothetical protein
MAPGASAAGNGGVRWRAAPVRRWITPRRVAFVLLVVAVLLAARSCQQSQIRVSQDRAIATARGEVGFKPTQTQVRLVRQGLNSHPYWAVSLSVPREATAGQEATSGDDAYRRLAVVRVDANTGKVVAVTYPKRSSGG